MKKHEMRRLLQQEIVYPELTIRADQAFDAALACLDLKAAAADARACGEPQRAEEARHWDVQASAAETKKHGGFGKICGIACSAVAAVCVCLALLNLGAPEMMESIPGMGEVFQALNGKFTMGNNSPTYPDLIQPVDVNAGTPACQVTVQEAYSEGKYIFLSLKLTSEDANVNAAKFLSPQFIYDEDQQGYRKEYSVAVDGQEVELLREIVFEKGEDGFTSAAVIALPEKAEHGQMLQVELQLNALRGLKEGTEYRWDTPPEVEVEEPVALSFEVTANTAYNKAGPSGLTADGVTLESFESTPSVFSATFTYPMISSSVVSKGASEGEVEARTEDGVKLDFTWDGSKIPEDYYTRSLGDELTWSPAFNGVPKGTKKVILTLYNVGTDGSAASWVDGGVIGPCVFAEFTVDLETGDVTATETYKDQGYEKFLVTDYIAALKAGPQFTSHFFRPKGSLGYGRIYTPEEAEEHLNDEDPGPGAWTLSFYTDTESELPYEVRFFRDGEVYRTVPLGKTEEAVETEYGYVIAKEEYAVGVDMDLADTGLIDAIKRCYNVTVYLDATEVASVNGDTIDRYQTRIVNTETGEVLFDSTDPLPEHSAGEFTEQSGS